MKIKKIIAKEFLLLLAALLLTGLVYLVLILANIYYNNRVDSNNTELSVTINQQKKFYETPLKPKDTMLNQRILDQIVEFYEIPIRTFKIGEDIYDIPLEKVTDFLNENPKSIEIKSFENHDIFIFQKFPQLKNDSILLNASFDYHTTVRSGKYKNKKEINLKFPEFFIIEKSDKDSLDYFKNKINDTQANINSYNNKVIDKIDIAYYTLISGIIIFSLFFVIRYLIYSIIWSLKTLKGKDIKKNQNESGTN